MVGLAAVFILGISLLRSPNEIKNGYTIVFDEMPNLYEDEVYNSNQVIGHIVAKTEGTTRVSKMVVFIGDEFQPEMGTHIAFYADRGRLNVTHLQSVGTVLSKDALICGFSSKADLNWFKFLTLLKNRVSAANRRAATLYRKSGLS